MAELFIRQFKHATGFEIKLEALTISQDLFTTPTDDGEIAACGAHILQKYFIEPLQGGLPWRPRSTTFERLVHPERGSKSSLHGLLRVCGHVLDNPGNSAWQRDAQKLMDYLVSVAPADERPCLSHLRARSSDTTLPLVTHVVDAADLHRQGLDIHAPQLAVKAEIHEALGHLSHDGFPILRRLPTSQDALLLYLRA